MSDLHIMLDLETMGTRPDAAIIAIGAVAFEAGGLLGTPFYSPVSLASSMDNGGTVDADTITWWMLRQSDSARAVITGDAVHINLALMGFSEWLTQTANSRTVNVWGNGADFDNVILTSAYRHCGHELPWNKFRNRCYRTVKSQRPDINLPRTGTHHNALDDATSQAQHLMAIWAASATGQGATQHGSAA